MTLIVAVKCASGVVIGSDTLATASTDQYSYSVNTKYSKIKPLGKGRLWAAACNDYGIVQKIEAEVNRLDPDLLEFPLSKLKETLKSTIHNIIIKSGKEELKRTRKWSKDDPPYAEFIIVEYYDNPIIWCITTKGAQTISKSDTDINMACVGIENLASPFLNKYLSSIPEMSLAEIKFLVYKSIDDSIKSGLEGIGKPIDIWVISRNKIVTQIPENEVKRLEEASNWSDREIIRIGSKAIDDFSRPNQSVSFGKNIQQVLLTPWRYFSRMYDEEDKEYIGFSMVILILLYSVGLAQYIKTVLAIACSGLIGYIAWVCYALPGVFLPYRKSSSVRWSLIILFFTNCLIFIFCLFLFSNNHYLNLGKDLVLFYGFTMFLLINPYNHIRALDWLVYEGKLDAVQHHFSKDDPSSKLPTNILIIPLWMYIIFSIIICTPLVISSSSQDFGVGLFFILLFGVLKALGWYNRRLSYFYRLVK